MPLLALLTMGCLPPPPGASNDTGGFATDVVDGRCDPNPLECGTCAFADDQADRRGILRVYQCETDDGRVLDAVRRTDAASLYDTHFYGADDGLRVAAQRVYDLGLGACRDIDDEWWGEVLDCAPTCEHERLTDSDETFPDC